MLGKMDIFEHAAAYFPGFGVKLWLVLQDANQLARNYPKSWQTFMGNSGTIQLFGLNDKFTLDHISERLGSLSFVRGQFGAVGRGDDSSKDYIDKERLAYAGELAMAFSREQNSQLLMTHGNHPMAIERFTFDEVEAIKRLR